MKYLNLNITFLFCLLFMSGYAQDTIFLDRQKALDIALQNNHLIKIFHYKTESAHAGLAEMKSHYWPRLELEASYAYNSNPDIHAYKGEFSHIYHDLIDVGWIDEILEEYFPLPPKDMVLIHGEEFFYKTKLSLYQPVTQLTTVNTGRKIAETDYEISKAEKEKVVSEIEVGVTELYYGILIETRYEEAALLELEYKLRERQDAINAYEGGELLEVDVFALKAEVNEKEQELLQIRNKKEKYRLTLKQVLALPAGARPILANDTSMQARPGNLDEYIRSGLLNNHELQIAGLTVEKAQYGIDAAKKEYIPELAFFMQYNFNHGIPLYPDSYFLAGFNLKWTLMAAGQRKALVSQREALQAEAYEDMEYKKISIRNEVEKVWLDIRYAHQLIETAQNALHARKEALRLSEDAYREKEILESAFSKARANLKKAEADLFAARANLIIQHTKLAALTNK
ncbi:MAG: TolC family protein [Bacteroidales bacterium]|nr:TolC family protein [Bacteroidales bacterium]